MNRFEQASVGLILSRGPRVVAVDDGADTWLCQRDAFDAAESAMRDLDAYDGECGAVDAYDDMVAFIKGPVASLIGGNRRDWKPLVVAALEDGTISDSLARTFNPEVGR